jgi:hypothetical protein
MNVESERGTRKYVTNVQEHETKRMDGGKKELSPSPLPTLYIAAEPKVSKQGGNTSNNTRTDDSDHGQAYSAGSP